MAYARHSHPSHASLLGFPSLILLLLSTTPAIVSGAAIPDPTSIPDHNPDRVLAPRAPAPIITPAAHFSNPSHRFDPRNPNIIDNIHSGADKFLHSLGSVIGKDLPSYVISGITPYHILL